MRIAVAQINATVGAVDANIDKVRAAARLARSSGAEVFVTPELVVSGYPPEDLLLRPAFVRQCEQSVQRLAQDDVFAHMVGIIGAPWQVAGERAAGVLCSNSAVVMVGGGIASVHHKRILPNHDVFDEQRYFKSRDHSAPEQVVRLPCGVNLGVLICEDAWHGEPMSRLVAAEVDAVCVLNASPFVLGKAQQRRAVVQQRVKESAKPVVYANMVGGQDELVFDGASFAVCAGGEVTALGGQFSETIVIASLGERGRWRREQTLAVSAPPLESLDCLEDTQQIYCACVLAIRDYVEKSGHSSVLLGLSGGIDSALCAVMAADALGANAVEALIMPSPYTSDDSVTDATSIARSLGIAHTVIAITALMDEVGHSLRDSAARLDEHGVAAQNIQARLRGILLMARSNSRGSLLLSTGNKSEMAVGYSTLYGDMNGAFNPLKDLYKGEVYRLARLRNGWIPPISRALDGGGRGGEGHSAPPIPQRVLTRAPSAELRPEQSDQDTLPPYEQLDAILQMLIEDDRSTAEAEAAGYAASVVQWVAAQVQANEYKRRQAPPGPKVKPRNFGRGRRYPIINGWREGAR